MTAHRRAVMLIAFAAGAACAAEPPPNKSLAALFDREFKRGLEEVPDKARPVFVYSDSAYSIGLLTQNWKAKANTELVTKLRALTKLFKDLRFVKVAGHAGIPLNERVDELARNAVTRRR